MNPAPNSALQSPHGLIDHLCYDVINPEVSRLSNVLERDAVERIRRLDRKSYFDGLRDCLWGSEDEFGEQFFPEGKTAQARRSRVQRLLNMSFDPPRPSPPREDILRVGRALGHPVDDLLHRAGSLETKREALVRAVVPRVQPILESVTVPPPFAPAGPLSPALTLALAGAGMPGPEVFNSWTGFNHQVEMVRDTVQGITHPESYYAALWPMLRLPLPGFDDRLLQAVHAARARHDPRGDDLAAEVALNQTILRAIRHAARETGRRTIKEVVGAAAERLTRRHHQKMSAKDLEELLYASHVTVQAIMDRRVTAGWMIWHNPSAQRLSDALLPAAPAA